MKKIERYNSFKKTIWQLLFLCLPLSVLMYFLLQNVSVYYEILNKQYILQSIYFTIGLILSCILYSYRFRFLPVFLCLLVLFWLSDKFLDNFAPGEFDSFFLALQFSLFTTLFLIGWVCGWGLARVRVFPIILSLTLLISGLFLYSKTVNPSYINLFISFIPLVLFGFYLVYMSELIRNTSESQPNAWWRLVKHLVGFSFLMTLLFIITFSILRSDLKKIEEEWGDASIGDDPYSMMQTNANDSTIKMKDKLSVQNRLNRGTDNSQSSNRPLFVAYLDNFFPNSKVPNPLYFVTDYFTKFDDYTETFEIDKSMPYNDLFYVNPTQIPLYFTRIDTLVIANGMSTLHRKVVDIEVYKVAASPDEFTAPSTAFFCQPIAVQKEFEGQFKSAYRAKSFVSDLNSAYFVYNPNPKDYRLQQFQEQRFDLLRNVSEMDYNNLDTAFVNYYTQMPQNTVYDTINALAKELTKNAYLPIDKVLAIRDYFLSGDDEGKPLFQYSNTAGPVPAGSRLLHFLLNERKGYCAHFAGSTLFLLRASGIPARLAVGYLVEDRSTKNTGWYWIYEKQSHAWIQVFFPNYGWLDFDTTVGDEEQREAGQADGTPPLEPNKAWFAGTGIIADVDTIKQQLQFIMNKMVYHDVEFKFDTKINLKLDMHVTKIYRDSIQIALNSLKKGDQGLAISFAQIFADMPAATPKNIDSLLKAFPNPAPIDEFRVSTEKQKEEVKEEVKETRTKSGKFNYFTLFIVGCLLIIILIVAILITPFVIYKLYRKKAFHIRDAMKEAYYPYRAAMYLLNQMGVYRGDLTPLEYAKYEIDINFETNFEHFILIYLKVKYANQELVADEKKVIIDFYNIFEHKIKLKYTRKQRFFKFLNIYNTLNYFTQSSKYGFTR